MFYPRIISHEPELIILLNLKLYITKNQRTMVLTVLDYSRGKTTVITDFPKGRDAEEFVSAFFGLDNVEYMLTVGLSLEIATENELNLNS
jgi:hypothetical protein